MRHSYGASDVILSQTFLFLGSPYLYILSGSCRVIGILIRQMLFLSKVFLLFLILRSVKNNSAFYPHTEEGILGLGPLSSGITISLGPSASSEDVGPPFRFLHRIGRCSIADSSAPRFFIHPEPQPPTQTSSNSPTTKGGLSDPLCRDPDALLLELLRKHPRRTFDPRRARLFVIPVLLYNQCDPLRFHPKEWTEYLATYMEGYLLGSLFFRRFAGRDHIIFGHNWRMSAFWGAGLAVGRNNPGWGVPWKRWWAPLNQTIMTRNEFYNYSIWDAPVGPLYVSKTNLTSAEERAFQNCKSLLKQKWEMTRHAVTTPYAQHVAEIVESEREPAGEEEDDSSGPPENDGGGKQPPTTPGFEDEDRPPPALPPIIDPNFAEWSARPSWTFYQTRVTGSANNGTHLRHVALNLKEDFLANAQKWTFGETAGTAVLKQTVHIGRGRISHTEWISRLSESKFALVMRGDTPTSHSLVSAIAAGVIPVVVSDPFALVAPLFSEVLCLRLTDFAVVVEEDEFLRNPPGVVDLLKHLARDEDWVRRTLEALRMAQRAYLYTGGEQEANGVGSAFLQTCEAELARDRSFENAVLHGP